MTSIRFNLVAANGYKNLWASINRVLYTSSSFIVTANTNEKCVIGKGNVSSAYVDNVPSIQVAMYR